MHCSPLPLVVFFITEVHFTIMWGIQPLFSTPIAISNRQLQLWAHKNLFPFIADPYLEFRREVDVLCENTLFWLPLRSSYGRCLVLAKSDPKCVVFYNKEVFNEQIKIEFKHFVNNIHLLTSIEVMKKISSLKTVFKFSSSSAITVHYWPRRRGSAVNRTLITRMRF